MAEPGDIPPHRYTAAMAGEIELRWQEAWERLGAFRALNPGDEGFDPAKPKFYCLDMFPYPSGEGLHVGHPEGYTATDIISRYRRMKGFSVLHPMGWDAFGLPAEQYAVRTGIHPAITTRQAIDTFRRQLKRFGFSYDWSREIATIDPDYYRWTQWIFLRLYHAWYDREQDTARPIAELESALQSGVYGIDPSGEIVPMRGREGSAIPGITGEPVGVRLWHELSQEERRLFVDSQRLAYLDVQTVNWCPALGTVLANEEVKSDGRSERGDHPVHRKKLRQWMFRITAYAQRLGADLATVDWPESTRIMQTEWIGRSEGAEIDFALTDDDRLEGAITVYTTRPDTIFGATYMVLAPEHPLVQSVLDIPPPGADVAAIADYVMAARNRTDIERQAEGKDKTGVFSGVYAFNPASGADIPVWIADYVLMGYGHGAIMAVPAHDERDYDFAVKFGLPIKEVVQTFEEDFSEGFKKFIARNRFHPHFDLAVWIKPEQLREDQSFIEEMRGRGPHRPEGNAIAIVEDAAEDGVFIATRHETALGNPALKNAQGFKLNACVDMPGIAVNSSSEAVSIDGLDTAEAKAAVITWLEHAGLGRRKVNYKLRDWLFSRQRYWGEPFPIVYDGAGNHYPVSESALPVKLPEMKQYKPAQSDDPAPMLAGAPREWRETTAGAAGVDPNILAPETPVRRELNTMPNWAGSCWYYLRFVDPGNRARFIGEEAERYWMDGTGVDLYVGGAEHAVLHLLYARFWHKVLYDLGYVSTPEPARKLFHQGMITSFAYQRPDRTLVPVDQVWELRYDRDGGGGGGATVRGADGGEIVKTIDAAGLPGDIYDRLKRDGTAFVVFGAGADTGAYQIQDVQLVTQIVAKMSKSLKNVVNPDDVIAEFGVDTMRLYEMYMGPLEASKPWNPRDITGLFRFLQRAWRVCIDETSGHVRAAAEASPALERELHRLIAKAGPAIDKLAFNTAIAAMIEFVNEATSAGQGTGSGSLTRDQIGRFALVLSPFAPHLAEELWTRAGNSGLAMHQPWPAHDESLFVQSHIEIPVQIAGKLRARISVPAGADPKMMETAALADTRIQEMIAGKTIKKVVVVPGKMINIVAV
jgi:leucyl-tRNA synthetase